VVTLLSIVYSDASDIGFGGYTGSTIYNTLTRSIVTTKTYVTGITIYNTQQCNHQNLCHRHHYMQYSDMIHCNHQNLCHWHHYIQYSDTIHCNHIGFGGYHESCQSIVYSDASDIGFGGYIVEYCI
jgi:hypothetical protein